jgi:hypothetical protein
MDALESTFGRDLYGAFVVRCYWNRIEAAGP